MFDDILNAKPFDPLEKYANLSAGIAPNQLASVTQAQEFLPFLEKLISSKGQFFKVAEIIAIPSGMQGTAANAISVAQIVADGFPVDKRINLHYVFGEKRDDAYEGDTRIVNVAMAIRKYFGIPGIAGNPDGLWLDVKPRG